MGKHKGNIAKDAKYILKRYFPDPDDPEALVPMEPPAAGDWFLYEMRVEEGVVYVLWERELPHF
ncbi:MAG TPA: hypothetical protein VJ742_12885 [Nitrososphaera sp.]|nr:hypothetical protein [Nitrososphaera sp.]